MVHVGGMRYRLEKAGKRFAELAHFMELHEDIRFLLIGKVFRSVPGNCICTGYIEEPHGIAAALRSADGFVNFSYRDPATKTVPQAIACGLPVLYADSGGVAEMVGPGCGIPVHDNNIFGMECDVPPLDSGNVQASFERFMDEFDELKACAESFDSRLAFRTMLDQWFDLMDLMIERR